MKKILFYFYLLCFALLIIVGGIDIFAQEEYFYSMILAQLIWGPVAIIHCFFKFFSTRGMKGRIPRLYAISLVITLVYFASLAVVSSLSNISFDEDALVLVGIMIVPWTMLAFFTSIQYLELKEQKA